MRLLATVACVALGGCLALGPLDGLQVGTGGGGGNGGVGDGGAGGMGGAGGSGGTGGGECGELAANACTAPNALVRQLGGAGELSVHHLRYRGDGNVIMVGLFSGTVQLGSQQVTAAGTDGFLYEVDAVGNYVTHLVLPEADAASDIFVHYDAGTDVVAVGGTYQEANGSCPGDSGFFGRLLTWDTTNYVTLYSVDTLCQSAGAGAVVRAYDVIGTGFNTTGFINIAGTFMGTLGANTSTGIDGVVIGFQDNESVANIVIGGAGDQIVRGMQGNADNQLLVAGDFTEAISISIPQPDRMPPDPLTFAASATGDRDVFLATVDGHPEFGNLDVVVLGTTGATHEMVSLSYAPQTTRAAMLLRMGGDLTVETTAIDRPDATDAALVLDFIPPVEGTTSFAYVSHSVLSGETMNVTHLARTQGNEIHVGGTAVGAITVDGTTVLPASCAEEVFLVSLDGASLATMQRCGDGSHEVSGLTWTPTTGLAAVLAMPVGSSLDVGEGRPRTNGGSGSDAILLLQE